jgi:hypothetical protein
MLDRIIAQVAFALFAWLDQRISKGKTAMDAPADVERLRRAGRRIDEWLRREQDRVRSREQPDADGTGVQGQDLHAEARDKP